jgi:glutamine phosphoribosylpyrophosphate amidotransferase
MCGLVGYVGLGKQANFAKALLVSAQVRGQDATGYVEVSGSGLFLLKKKNQRASRFVENFNLHLNNSVTFLGHTRKATCGGNGPMQAHPFISERYILMHNGWFVGSEWKRLEKKFGITCPNGVDSELFLSFLEKAGDIETLRDDFLPHISQTNARYMLVIFDKQLKQVHFLKDGEQVFSYGNTDNGAMIYGSTVEIVQNAAGKDAPKLVNFPSFSHFIVDAISGAVISRHKIPTENGVLDSSSGRRYDRSHGQASLPLALGVHDKVTKKE